MNHVDNRILGKMFDTVIYGAGKGIYRTFSDYVQGAEDYFNAENMLYYFGDLDYEGILIYEHLAGMPCFAATVLIKKRGKNMVLKLRTSR